MDKVSGVLTVFFEEPFWVGVFQRITGGKLTACKVTFGAEPKDYEVYDFILKNYDRLRFSPAVATDEMEEASQDPVGSGAAGGWKRCNPKRLQREVHRQVESTGISTKSQQALKLQQEQMKLERKTVSREQREAEKARKFELKQQKRKQKLRGR